MVIDKIIYINLQSRQDKKSFILNQLMSAPKKIPIIRSNGILIDKEDISKIKFAQYLINEKTEDRELCGILGANLAHKLALQNALILSDNNAFSLIVEDDIYINKNFWKHISLLNPEHNTDIIFFDILRSQQVRQKNKSLFPNSYQYMNISSAKNGLYGGAFCYAVKNKKINKILRILERKNKKFINHYDQLLFHAKRIQKYISICNLIDVNFGFGSDRVGCKTEKDLVDRGYLA